MHLKSKHSINVKELQAYQEQEKSSTSQHSVSVIDESEPSLKKIKTIDSYFSSVENKEIKMKMISRMTAKDGLPFRIFCNSEDLRFPFQSAGLMLPTSSTSIRNLVVDYSNEIKNKIALEILTLKETGQKFSVTFDE